MKRHCPRYDKEFKKAMNSPEIRQINKEHEELYNYLSEHTGKNVADPTELQFIFNTLYIEASQCHLHFFFFLGM
jgi:two-component SAPR family response regulator